MLVAVEGVDGSGKGTQTRLLEERARANGCSVVTFSFPRYGHNAFGDLAGRYLNGDFGDAPPELVALVYAGDRWMARAEILTALAAADVVVCDRYVASNEAHQGSRIDASERGAFFDWLESIEYGLYELPRPALTVLLDIPAETASELVLKKEARSYTQLSQDILENPAHGATARDVYRLLAERGPNWRVVDATRGGELRAPEDIADEVWEAVRSLL